ncbi:MAG: 2-C-methyl-D-erythritol 4-phosphate cytidylyltransferase [Candidatus Aminicenantes bacterium]|nr:2-C-methyl-D-erythritol 4-phosphate cytidylyltransferase [Candidatus Aminicenantes bacterium]MCK5003928.1 2-C-methyl-D-erythritol 4-phosphate cytidylyltransferase [Candidatus Aminicenantes bacterium]
MKNLAIIMSGGSGSRMNSDTPKQLLKIGKENLLELTIKKFHEHPDIDLIYIISQPDLIETTKRLVAERNFSKVSKILPGGLTRQLSSGIGVAASENDHENILIHDSARPFISQELISRVLSKLEMTMAVTPVIDSSDTLIRIDDSGNVQKYLDRDEIKRVQTPQGFKREVILKAHLEAEKASVNTFTDDCSMIIHYEISDVALVEGDPLNLKITYREDLNRIKIDESKKA